MNKTTFKSVWERCEKNAPFPEKARKIKIVNFNEFREKVLEESNDFVKE